MNIVDFITSSPTPFHAVDTVKKELDKNGFTELKETENAEIKRGGKYYFTRNLSSLIAFKMPDGEFSGFNIAAAHTDSPCFKIKDNAQTDDGAYVKLSSEKYGGMLCAPWFDRPLSVAGRVCVKKDGMIESVLADLKEPVAIIPHVAIHMDRNANQNASYNPATDMIPLYALSGSEDSLKSKIAENIGANQEDILSWDMFLYNPEKPVLWNGFITSPRLDDLQCAYSALEAFLSAEKANNCQVLALFDNEEVGSETKQGAASTFLYDVLVRIAGDKTREKIASGFLVSCDNAHAVHPNHPEYADKNHSVYMNGGVVIKYNADQKYTSDAVSSAIFALICQRANVPVQKYANRADMAGGSTLGNISNTQVSVNAVDIGLAQLAMHSATETAGAKDTEYAVSALKEFFRTEIICESDGKYRLI